MGRKITKPSQAKPSSSATFASGHLLLLGVDPGTTTGLALYDPVTIEVWRLMSMTYEEARAYLSEALRDPWVLCGDSAYAVLPVIEQPPKMLYERNRRAARGAARDKIAIDVGRVRQMTEGLAYVCREAAPHLPPRMAAPVGAAKWSHADMVRITGHSPRTSNQHQRDALRLVYGASAAQAERWAREAQQELAETNL